MPWERNSISLINREYKKIYDELTSYDFESIDNSKYGTRIHLRYSDIKNYDKKIAKLYKEMLYKIYKDEKLMNIYNYTTLHSRRPELVKAYLNFFWNSHLKKRDLKNYFEDFEMKNVENGKYPLYKNNEQYEKLVEQRLPYVDIEFYNTLKDYYEVFERLGNLNTPQRMFLLIGYFLKISCELLMTNWYVIYAILDDNYENIV